MGLQPVDDVWRRITGFRLNAAVSPPVPHLTDGAHIADVIAEENPSFDSRWAERIDEGWLVNDLGRTFVMCQVRHDGAAAGAGSDGAILSPMPGRVIAMDVAAGDAVAKGQRLLVLEAMTMEHALVAPFDGTVAEVNAQAGGQVAEGAVLVRVCEPSQ